VAKVLNLQVINFATGSDVPPKDAQIALVKSVDALKACAAKDKAVKLQVGGYSDNVGQAGSNLVSSKKRAEAVRKFLVKYGVPANSLTAEVLATPNRLPTTRRPAAGSPTAGSSSRRRSELGPRRQIESGALNLCIHRRENPALNPILLTT
jgi:outer membrane protein OmpA-like peptidoglycan-associated protein